MKDTEALKKRISEYVSLGDILKKDRRIHGGMEEEQLSCPFHGKDFKKSSRYYQHTDSMYCWVCKKSWDIYGYLMQRDQQSFSRVVDTLVREYRVDVSTVPDIHEAVQQRRDYKATKPVVNNRVLQLEKLKQAIRIVRDEIDQDKYRKMVFCFQVLKYVTSDEKFQEEFVKVRDGVLRAIKG